MAAGDGDGGDSRAKLLARLKQAFGDRGALDGAAAAWRSQQPVSEDQAALWVAFDVDGSLNGAGATSEETWESALDSEILALFDDDTDRDAVAFRTEILTRARRQLVAQVRVAPGHVGAFCKLIGAQPGSRVYQLIESMILTAGGAP